VWARARNGSPSGADVSPSPSRLVPGYTEGMKRLFEMLVGMWLCACARPAAAPPEPPRVDTERVRSRLEALAGPALGRDPGADATAAPEPAEPAGEPGRESPLLERPLPVRAVPTSEPVPPASAVRAPTSGRRHARVSERALAHELERANGDARRAHVARRASR